MVDQRVARQHACRQFRRGAGEAEVATFLRQAAHKGLQHVGVVAGDWPDGVEVTALHRPFARVGAWGRAGQPGAGSRLRHGRCQRPWARGSGRCRSGRCRSRGHGAARHRLDRHAAAARAGRGFFAAASRSLQKWRTWAALSTFDAAGMRQRGHLQPDFVGPVSRQQAGVAAVGDDRQPLAHRPLARGQAIGSREQLGEQPHSHRTGAAKAGFDNIVAAADGRRVRPCAAAAGRLAARLHHHHHRLGLGRRPQRAHEAPCAADAFRADQDGLSGVNRQS